MERDNKYIYNILPRIMCSCVKYTSVFLAQNLGKNIFHFNFLIQLFTYLYLEKNPVIVFQGIFCIQISLLLSRVIFFMYKHK